MQVAKFKTLIERQTLLLSEWGAKPRDIEELQKFSGLLCKFADLSMDEFCGLIEGRPIPTAPKKPPSKKTDAIEIARKFVDRFQSDQQGAPRILEELKADPAVNLAVLKAVAEALLGAASDLKTKAKLLGTLEAWAQRQADREFRSGKVEGGF